MIEAEHARVETAVRAGKIRRERPVARWNGHVELGKQRILLAFPAADLQRVTPLLQGRADAHGAVFVQKVA